MLAACADPEPLPPRGQVLLYVDTDAVLPAPEGSPAEGSLDPQPLFDRMTIEIFSPGAVEPCAGCRREFSLDRGMFQRAEASIGVLTPPGETGHRARVRMYRAEAVKHEQPPPNGTLEANVMLPAVEEDGIVEVTAVLWTDALGVPVGTLDAPVEPTPGKPVGDRVGTWPPAQRVDCGGSPEPGEVCVPGGAYWMGAGQLVGVFLDGDQQRLVVVPPFYIGAAEVTVAELRAAGLEALEWSGKLDGEDDEDWCTFTPDPGPRDALPVNCVDWPTAREFCNSRGTDLPTEAQWEYVARGLRGRVYPWGSDPPSCDDAVWGHGLGKGTTHACPVPGLIGGPQIAGTGLRDRLELSTGTIVDLAGNVIEWTRDAYNAQTEPCWAGKSLLFDPLCEGPSAAGEGVRSTRGDSFEERAMLVPAASRHYGQEPAQRVNAGFRCMRLAPL